MEYINWVRVEEAKKMLKNSNLKIYEIAERIGFNNTSYFCTTFKKITGVKISDYKRLENN